MFNLRSEYQEDLEYLIDKYEKTFVAPYYCFSKEQLDNYIRNYLDDKKIENELDFLYFLKCIIKQLNGTLDSHTTVKRNRKFFPLLFKIFNNELFVIKTGKGLEKYEFCKLKSINKIPYKQLINEVLATISYSTEGWKEAQLEREFDELYSLLYLPSISGKYNELNLIFENEKQQELEFNFDKDSQEEDIELDKENCSFEIVDDTIHYIYNSCIISEKDKLIESIEKLKQVNSNDNIKNFILDLRQNTGGSSSVVKPLIEYLSKQNYKLYVFVDRYTFSSGVMALEDILKLGVISIGEGIGSALNSFGSLDGIFELPNTKFSLRISTRFFPATGGAITNQIDFKNKIKQDNLVPVFYKPDIIAKESIEDFKNKIDRCWVEFKKIKLIV